MINRPGVPIRTSYFLGIALLILSTALPATAANLFRGGEVYAEHCQQCHGSDGRGVLPGAPDFRRSQVFVRPDTELFALVSNGKGVMPGYQGVLSNEDILAVIGYLRTLR